MIASGRTTASAARNGGARNAMVERKIAGQSCEAPRVLMTPFQTNRSTKNPSLLQSMNSWSVVRQRPKHVHSQSNIPNPILQSTSIKSAHNIIQKKLCRASKTKFRRVRLKRGGKSSEMKDSIVLTSAFTELGIIQTCMCAT